jgi:hypothetical protein
MAEIRSVEPRPYWRFFANLPRAYCLACLSRFFEEPPETIREFLMEWLAHQRIAPGAASTRSRPSGQGLSRNTRP